MAAKKSGGNKPRAKLISADPSVQSNSVVGSAIRLTGPGAQALPRRWNGATDAEGWQSEAWRFYETVGELRFAANWIGQALSRVRLYAAQAQDGGQEPEPTDSGPAMEAVMALAGGPEGQAEMLRRLGIILTVPGAGYLIGEPAQDNGSLRDAKWFVTSGNELSRVGPDLFAVNHGAMGKRPLHPDTLIIRVWRSHPRRWWEADSPTRGALPVLAELEMLTQHVLASAQSRLAGAGILVLPQELSFPAPGPDTDPELAATDPFLVELTDAMTTAIQDRSSVSSVVPIVLRVPGEWIDKIQHIKLEFPLDAQAKDLRDESIRRLAAAMDVPSEIILGLGDVNHWSAWQLSEQAVTVHVVPLAVLIVDALTQHFLHPVLEAMGEPTDGTLVWFDTSALTSHPNQAADAKDVYDRYGIGLDTLRRATGFADDDAPTAEELNRRILLELIKAQPTLAPDLLDCLGISCQVTLPTTPTPAPQLPAGEPDVPVGDNEAPTQGPPAERPTEPPPPTAPTGPGNAALLAAADVLLMRALERAGNRYRTKAGKAFQTEHAGLSGLAVLAAAGRIPVGDLGDLLVGAWDFVPELAARHGVDSLAFANALDGVARSLLANGEAYTFDRLTSLTVG